MAVKLKGQNGTTRGGLTALLNRLKNPGPALDDIGKALVASTQRRLKDTKESPAGVPWAPWTLGTLLGRIKKGNQNRGLLFDSGNLYNSINYQVQGKGVTVGVSNQAPYAVFLQNGTPKMVARPFIGVSKNDQEVIGSILRRHISSERSK